MVPQVKMMRISTAQCTPRKGIRSKWEEKRREKRTEAKGEGREKGKKEKIHWKRTEKKEEKRNENRTDKRGHRQNVGLRPRNLEKWPPACQCVLMETWKWEKYSLVHWQHVQPMAHCRCIGMHNWGIRKMGMDQYLLNTIFRGMNIHLPAILMFTRGTRFWHIAKSFNVQLLRMTHRPETTWAPTQHIPLESIGSSYAGNKSRNWRLSVGKSTRVYRTITLIGFLARDSLISLISPETIRMRCLISH